MDQSIDYTSAYVENFLSFLSANEEQLVVSTADLDDANADMCDIEHFIEFEPADGKVMLQLYKQYRNVRQRRRLAKDQIELSTPVSEWFARNQQAVRELRDLLGKMRKIERQQATRAYCIRGHILDGFTTKTHLTRLEELG